MKVVNRLSILFLLAAVSALMSTGAAGQSASGSSDGTNAFRIKLPTDRDGSGRSLGFRALIDYRGKKYTAVLPESYRGRSSTAQKRVVGYHTDGSCSLTVAFWPSAKLKEGQKFDHDFLRWWIKQQSNGGNIAAETWGICFSRRPPRSTCVGPRKPD